MQFNGGKASCAKDISQIINWLRPVVYWEPFVGAANVIQMVKADTRLGSDLDGSIIALLNSVRQGWEPPTEVDEQLYRSGRSLPDADPLKAFLKFGCSFGGKPWGGFARSGTRNYALNAANSLRKQRARIKDVRFIQGDYRFLAREIKPDVIYCDPPYEGTTSVGAGGSFNTAEFFDWCRSLGCPVFVSELTAPEDFVCIWKKKLKDGLGPRRLTERLFIRKDQIDCICSRI